VLFGYKVAWQDSIFAMITLVFLHNNKSILEMGAIIKNCCEGGPPKLPPPVTEKKHHAIASSTPRTEHAVTMLH
jgi:hypothetical protein